jgi:hypothetical protein
MSLSQLFKNDIVVVWSFLVVSLVLCSALNLASWNVETIYPPQDNEGHTSTNQTEKWKTVDVQVLSKDGSTQEGTTSVVEFPVQGERVLAVMAELQWTDDIGSNDVFSLKIQKDGKEMGTEQGSSGKLQVSLDNGTVGYFLGGNYTASISAVSCPGLVGPSPLDRDNGNSWKLTVTAKEEVPDDG